jgi:hypothetical protein
MPQRDSLADWNKLTALVIALATMAVGLYIAIVMIILVQSNATTVPVSDQWDELLTGRPLSLTWLIHQHNHHSLVIPRLLSYVDAIFFAETNRFSYTLNLVLPAALAIVVSCMAARNRTDFLWALGVSLSLLFWVGQQEAFLWGWAVQNFFMNLAAFSTFAVMTRGGRPLTVFLVILLETISVYTMANGLIVPIIVLCAAFVLKWPRRYLAILALAMVGYIAAYMTWTYAYLDLHPLIVPPVSGDRLSFIRGLFTFFLVNLGGPFAWPLSDTFHWDQMKSTPVVAGGALLAFVVFAVGFLRLNRADQEKEIVFDATILWVTLTAAMTAIGRLGLGIDYALASRYMVAVMLFWLSLVMLAFCRAEARNKNFKLAIMLCTLPFVIFIGLNQRSEIESIQNDWHVWERRSSAIPALLTGVADSELIGMVSRYPDEAMQSRKILMQGHASVFSDAWSSWLGTKLTDHTVMAPEKRCKGAVTSTFAISDKDYPGWRATGWAWDDDRKLAPQKIILIDQNGMVIGYGLGGFHNAAPMVGAAWLGEFIGTDPDSMRALALLDNDTVACTLEKSS